MNVAGCMTLLLISISFSLIFPFVKSSVYYIKPDNQYVNISANTLDYYLQNATKYLASNNQLYFLPGVYKLNTVIKIQNVYNFSLIGIETKNDSVIIKCLLTGGIAIINSSYTNLKHLTMERCKSELSVNSIPGFDYSTYNLNASLLINNSHSINIHQLTLLKTESYDIILINVLSDSALSEVSSSGILAVYENYKGMQKSEHNLTITKYYPISPINCYKVQDYCYKLAFAMFDHPYHININITEITFSTEDSIFIRSHTCKGFNKVTIFNCNFTNITMSATTAKVGAVIKMNFFSCSEPYFYNKQMNQINVLNSYFFHNINYIRYLTRYIIIIEKIWFSQNGVTICISDSAIFENKGISFLLAKPIMGDLNLIYQPIINIIINNTRFMNMLESDDSILNLCGVLLQLEGQIIFTKIDLIYSLVVFGLRTHIYANGYIEFSNINALYIIQTKMFFLNANTLLNFTSNNAMLALLKRDDEAKVLYPPCLLQYAGNIFNYKEVDFNISIIMDDNKFSHFCENMYCTSHCSWDNTAFNEISPLDVNRKVIKKLHNLTLITDRKNICYCCNDDQLDCYVNEINSVYPGQIIHLNLINTIRSDSPITVYTRLPTSCRVGKNSELVQLVYNNCTKLQFTIHHSKKWCELFLSYSQTDAAVFYVNFLPCPPGFSLNRLEGYCQCDPILTSAKIISKMHCNINNRTILHPGNSWIYITLNHTYQVSMHCPFHYCLPYPSYLDLSNPDSQCQFNRVGVLCGQCKSGLSTMFGTPRCEHCSNTFLSITVGIILAGIMLVLLLFAVDLTVADGKINAFIFYINVVSINNFIIFTHQQTAAAHIFVSLVNLDLGFEMCFYNGMDDYINTTGFSCLPHHHRYITHYSE